MQLKNKNSSKFILSKKYLGKGLTIIVSQGFKYNHDDLFNNQQHRFLKGGSASYSWETHGSYTKTSGYPSWAASFVSNHRPETTESEILRLERKYDNKARFSVFIIMACMAIALYLIQAQ